MEKSLAISNKSLIGGLGNKSKKGMDQKRGPRPPSNEYFWPEFAFSAKEFEKDRFVILKDGEMTASNYSNDYGNVYGDVKFSSN